MNDLELYEKFEEDGQANYGKVGRIANSNEGEEPEFHVEKVKCQICDEIIGTCDMTKFETPMHGSLFLPKDSKHGYPPPFTHDFPWEELRCPYCWKRPFLSKNYFLNQRGEKCGHTVECPDCGKGFKSEQGLLGHKVHCEKPIRRI